jgi:hypothetical protein
MPNSPQSTPNQNPVLTSTRAGAYDLAPNAIRSAPLKFNPLGRKRTRTVRETEAEAVSFVVCEAVGLDTNTASADYIRMYSGDKAMLGESLHLIQSTAAAILTVITSEADATP